MDIDSLLIPGCLALGIRTPAHISIAIATSRTMSVMERLAARRMADARRSGDAVAAQAASDAAVAIGDGRLPVAL